MKHAIRKKSVREQYEEYVNIREGQGWQEEQMMTYYEFESYWEQASIDRKKGYDRSHESILNKILYAEEYPTARSVARKRKKILEDMGITEDLDGDKITLENLKRMSNEEYTAILEANGALDDLYENLKGFYELAGVKNAAEEASKDISRNYYGSR